jgi:membrane associated rhomboid family serine protease
MGIYSRDYLRDDYGDRQGPWRDFDPIKWLIIVNVAVFVLQVVWQHPVSHKFENPEGGIEQIEMLEPVLDTWFALDASALFGGQIWRFLTYEFLHSTGSIWHLVFNMYFLYLAGRKVEQYYGPREFLFFYLAAGVLSGVFSALWYTKFGQPGWSAIGASGAVAAVFIVYALYWPHDVFYMMGVIPVQAMWLAIFDVVLDVHPLLLDLGGRSSHDGVAHSAHVGGMIFALLYQQRGWRVTSLFDRVRIGRGVKRALKPKAKLRVYEPETPPVDLDSRVDELLAKVAQQGEASLTEAERAELVAASRKYRDRQR